MGEYLSAGWMPYSAGWCIEKDGSLMLNLIGWQQKKAGVHNNYDKSPEQD